MSFTRYPVFIVKCNKFIILADCFLFKLGLSLLLGYLVKVSGANYGVIAEYSLIYLKLYALFEQNDTKTYNISLKY